MDARGTGVQISTLLLASLVAAGGKARTHSRDVMWVSTLVTSALPPFSRCREGTQQVI